MADGQKKILLAEDDDFLSSLLRNRLEREGFNILLVKRGDEVIENMKTFKPDLMMLDIILPGKLGFEVLEDTRSDPKLAAIPFFVMSNLGQEEDIQKAKRLGAIDYFIKSRIMIDDVIKKIAEFLKKQA